MWFLKWYLIQREASHIVIGVGQSKETSVEKWERMCFYQICGAGELSCEMLWKSAGILRHECTDKIMRKNVFL